MEYKNIVIKKEDRIAVITISRPKTLNALNIETLKELDLVIEEIAKDDEVYAVILTGEGKAFVAGADIIELKDFDGMAGRKFSHLGSKIFRKLETLEKPVIAAVNGFALGGGCELSMACDIRIASSKAKFAQPEVKLGVIPGFGGTQRLARLVGTGMAKQLIYTGDMIDAEEALRIGLVNKIVEPEKLMEEVKLLAKKIVSNAPIAVKLCKTAINRGMQMDIDTALICESEVFGECFSTEDQKNGMIAFIEKRENCFKNK
ncbi:short-chain-enoyl-CoA hydratase [Clostridium sp.]|uniref:short-chain-enoyl-CoA hydratase n=1 Tax=Clostridium sp. TaxID=1506 RepID=UPI003D6D32E6